MVAMLGRLPEEVACMWNLEEPEGLSWLRMKGRGSQELRRARAAGEVEAIRQLPNSIPGFRKEGALSQSLTWLLDISKTEGSLKTRAFSSFCGVF